MNYSEHEASGLYFIGEFSTQETPAQIEALCQHLPATHIMATTVNGNKVEAALTAAGFVRFAYGYRRAGRGHIQAWLRTQEKPKLVKGNTDWLEENCGYSNYTNCTFCCGMSDHYQAEEEGADYRSRARLLPFLIISKNPRIHTRVPCRWRAFRAAGKQYYIYGERGAAPQK